MTEKFILTTDKQTAKTLISNGFVCLYNDGKQWTFLNKLDNKFQIENYVDVENVIFTNMLML